ncbi:LysR family transcriptional regulator, partial [Streptomyces sp. SID14478]|uniref:LysR substrate-binding domain-containing protein n=1 Tax=Streptomyces sp. SID14478 TaxID=2706073 RepID=UPI0014112FC2
LDVVTGTSGRAGLAAVREGAVDAAFWARSLPESRMPAGVRTVRVADEPVVLAIGPKHPLAGRESVSPAELAGHRLWMPKLEPDTEWGWYYAELAQEFGMRIDPSGPAFGLEHQARIIVDSDDRGTFLGTRTPLVRPTGLGLHLIPVRRPTPVYPHWLLWREDNPHPVLPKVRDYLTARHAAEGPAADDPWLPGWA